MSVAALPATRVWTRVCALEDIPPWTGVAALLGRDQVALVRWGADDRVYALDHFDPFSKAFVLARGIVGSVGEARVIASPVYKQRFRLDTGACLEDPSVVLRTWPVRVVDGRVEIALA